MTLTPLEVEQTIRLTLREWKMENIEVSFNSDLGTKRRAWGLYWPHKKKIELSPKILSSYSLFRHVFLHELGHALDHAERGSLRVNGRMNAHGKNFNKWCKILGIKKGRFIPQNLVA